VMAVAGVLIIVLGAVAATGYFLSRDGGERAAATATATAPAEVASPPATAEAQAQLSVTPTFQVEPQGGLTLTLEATEHVWVRVTRDGEAVFEELMAPGQVETWPGQQLVIVETGNGGGVLVTVNGQSQGAMCSRAQVCSRAWGPIGEVAVPAPAPTPGP
jgi:hypothetical protein